jgi:hypothetical protein
MAEARQQLSSLLRRFADDCDFDKLAASFADEFSRASDVPLDGQLQRTVELGKIDGSTVVQAREPSNHVVSKGNEMVSIHYGASVIEFPGRMEDSVSDLLSCRPSGSATRGEISAWRIGSRSSVAQQKPA